MALILAGCAPQMVAVSPALHEFRPVESVSEGYALVYVAYPFSEVAASSIYNTAISVGLWIDDKKLVQLPNRGYTWVEVAPGRHRIRGEWTHAQGLVSPAPVGMEIDAIAGHTIYVRLRHTGKTSLGPTVGGWVVGLPQQYMDDVAADFELASDADKAGLPWCRYSKPDLERID